MRRTTRPVENGYTIMLVLTEYFQALRVAFLSLALRGKLLAVGMVCATVFWFAWLVTWIMSGETMYAVAGGVTFDAMPVSTGMIVFDPTGPSQRREALIRDGRYELPAIAGLRRGEEYVVRVRAFRKTGRKYENADPAASFDEYEQYLPDHYYSDPHIKITVTRGVLANGMNVTLTGDSSR